MHTTRTLHTRSSEPDMITGLGDSELLRTRFIKTLEVLGDNQREMHSEYKQNQELKKHIEKLVRVFVCPEDILVFTFFSSSH
jgi:hypothetical protein